MNIKHQTILGSAIIASVIFSAPVMAKDYMVEPPRCTSSKGSIYIDKFVISQAFQSAGLKDPTGFIEAMVAESGCFRVTSSLSSAQFLLKAAPMSEAEFNQGKHAFNIQSGYGAQERISTSGRIPTGGRIPESSSSGGGLLEGMKKVNRGMQKVNRGMEKTNRGLYEIRRTHARLERGDASDIGNMLGSLAKKSASSKMKFGYIEITRRGSQQAYLKGADRSNTSKLSYANWSRITPSQKNALNNYVSSKKSRRVSGALVNAYYDLHSDMASASTGYSSYNSTGSSTYNTAGSSSYGSTRSSSYESTGSSSYNSRSSSNNSVMTAKKIIAALRKNENTFKRDYVGKHVTVYGKTGNVFNESQQYFRGFNVIDESDNGDMLYRSIRDNLVCAISDSDVEKYKYLDKGTRATFSGTIQIIGDGALSSPRLENCKLTNIRK